MGGFGSFADNFDVSGVVDDLVASEKTKAIGELPYSGVLWEYFAPAELVGATMDGKEATRAGFYRLTPKGKQVLIGGAIALAVGTYALFGRK